MADGPPGDRRGHGWAPVPDPTVLTTEALLREIKNLREAMEQRIDSNQKLSDAEFRRVAERFNLVESQRVEQKADTESAIKAALAAQKEAGDKAETATAKQLGQLGNSFETSFSTAGKERDDLKERIVKLESVRLGASESRSENRATTGQVIAVVVAAVSFLGLLVSVAGFVAYIALHK